jgi:hypothetical protein
MQHQIVRVSVRVLVSMVLGAVPAALYAGLVGTVHLSVYGRWDQIPAFTACCVLVGAALGLLGYFAWTLTVEATLDRAGSRSLPRDSQPPESTRGTVDDGRGSGRPLQRAGQHAAVSEHPVRPDRFAWLCRGFESRN